MGTDKNFVIDCSYTSEYKDLRLYVVGGSR